MTNAMRLTLMVFIWTLGMPVYTAAVFWLIGGSKMEKPLPSPLWSLPGEIAAFIVIAAVVWLFREKLLTV